MPLEKITERILEDARDVGAKILEKGKNDAGKIVAQYAEKIKNDEEKAMKKAETQASARQSQMINTAGRLARNEILAQKRDWIDRVLKGVKKDILDMPEPAYLALLANLVKKANLEGNEEIGLAHKDLVLQEKFRGVLRKKFPGNHFKFMESPFAIEAGIVIKKGQMFLNASIDAVQDELREKEERKIAQLLFPKEGSGNGV